MVTPRLLRQGARALPEVCFTPPTLTVLDCSEALKEALWSSNVMRVSVPVHRCLCVLSARADYSYPLATVSPYYLRQQPPRICPPARFVFLHSSVFHVTDLYTCEAFIRHVYVCLLEAFPRVSVSSFIAMLLFRLWPQVIDPDLRSWAMRLFDHWENHNETRKMKGLKPIKVNYKKLQPDEYTIETVFMRDALVRYSNMLKHDPKTADMMNLVLHTWVQIRGIRNAAYGFKSGSKRLSERIGESAVGAIFAKLWYERDPTVVSLHQHLKPFGAPLASMALQIGKLQSSQTCMGGLHCNVSVRVGTAIRPSVAAATRV